jgi:hypothetical protein
MLKNNVPESSPFFAKVSHTQRLLRVFEAVRAAQGDEPLGGLYAAFGEAIHHQGNSFATATELLAAAGLDASYADAFDDDVWDETIRTAMNRGLALTGADVGTPILGFTNKSGKQVGFFGPVISRRLPLQDGLDLWDGIQLVAGIDSFWELKRTRTEDTNFTLVD